MQWVFAKTGINIRLSDNLQRYTQGAGIQFNGQIFCLGEGQVIDFTLGSDNPIDYRGGYFRIIKENSQRFLVDAVVIKHGSNFFEEFSSFGIPFKFHYRAAQIVSSNVGIRLQVSAGQCLLGNPVSPQRCRRYPYRVATGISRYISIRVQLLYFKLQQSNLPDKIDGIANIFNVGKFNQ